MKGSNHFGEVESPRKAAVSERHITAITKRRFMPNLQRVKALINGEGALCASRGPAAPQERAGYQGLPSGPGRRKKRPKRDLAVSF